MRPLEPLLLDLQLKKTIDKLMSMPGAVRPEKARFFRSQMQTIITKALTDVGIKAVPSRRCFTVMGELPPTSRLPLDDPTIMGCCLGVYSCCRQQGACSRGRAVAGSVHPHPHPHPPPEGTYLIERTSGTPWL